MVMYRIREATLSSKRDGQGDKEGPKATEDISDEDEKEENWDEEMEKADADDDDDDDELEEGETPDKKDKTKVKEKKKEAKTSSKDDEREEGEEVDDDDDEEEEEEDDNGDSASGTASPPKKSDVKNESGVHVTIKQDSDARAVSEEGRKRIPRSMISGRPYIRLTCPHCYVRCITFKEYTLHLYTSKHINMMRKQSLRHKQTLARMRMSQRQKQRLVEETEEVHGNLAPRSNFCPVCKLNYRQLKSKHQASESHRAMKKFLMPYCRVCRMGFKSPMLYENHICSLDHLKRKARLEERMMHLHDRGRDVDDDGSGMDEDKELNMDNFMILDSVGTVDDTGDEGDGDDGKPRSEKDKEGEEKKSKSEINLGSEYVKKIEVYFCELCRIYLPRLDQTERALSIHCRTRTHLQRYVRYRDDRALRSKAEKIHHRKEVAKENAVKEAEAKKNLEEKTEGEDEKKDDGASSSNEKDIPGKECVSVGDTEAGSKNSTEGTAKLSQEGRDISAETTAEGGAEGDGDMDQDLESGMDDKLWADVDKDLGELLREVVEPGNKSSDEDDDSRAEGGRYDRFRYSEKGSAATADPPSEGDANKAAVEADETVTKSDAGMGTKVVENIKSLGDDKKQAVNDVPAAATAAAESN
ncbi:zinc finger protein on ecdysone puffs-like isoform X2 [Zootermopsis nevadensis]|uniref:zinc finger protein on ecdysone puffs-like isoform X2 n=1 Tax=Zootermopsis nevadensis TaxID=136037 RepID=UPI000B8E6B05|nr:zinc finger protein on ecdysone puffs-like isoform X2 [Zootermopsis nevadensis]